MNSSATLTGCDDIIKRLREAIAEHPLSPIHGYAEDIAALLDRLDKADEMRDVLLRNGFVECDISACNCGSWHHRYGLRERMREIEIVLADAGHELSHENGYSIIRALNALIAQLDAAEREKRLEAERLDWLESFINRNGAIHLHDGQHPYGVGLGLRPVGRTRTLRAAIDDARGAEQSDERREG